jgi:hypothetical protein
LLLSIFVEPRQRKNDLSAVAGADDNMTRNVRVHFWWWLSKR